MRFALYLLIACATFARAEVPDVLERITVWSGRLERPVESAPHAVGVVEEKEIDSARQNLQLDEALNRVPGVFAQNRYNFAQNLRLSVRGFGARAPFGVRGIRIVVDGIPETLPDGQSQLDAIDLESVSRIEVLRGPSSALYGNATGGVIDIRTLEGPQSNHMELRGVLGSDHFRRYGVRGGAQTVSGAVHFSAWEMAYDGYRIQSRTRKRMFNGKLRREFSGSRNLTAVLTAYDQPEGQDPGGLTRAQAQADRRAAAPGALTLDAGQQVRQHRLGLVYEDDAMAGGTLRARWFATRRDFAQQLPFAGSSRLGVERLFHGVGLDYRGALQIAGRPVHYNIGAEFDRQRDDRERFHSASGQQVQDERQTATAAGVFGQLEIALARRLDFNLAGRVDRVHLEIADHSTAVDVSGQQTFNELSGSVSLACRLTRETVGYIRSGTSFETPTFTEFARIDGTGQVVGGFNPDLKPQRAINFEIGLKGRIGEATTYDLALFQVRTRDEIVNTGTDPNQFKNAGRTRRNGLELNVQHSFTEQLSASVAYTWSAYRFREFVDVAGDYQGNRLPGLPVHAWFGELAWRRSNTTYVIVDTLLIGHVYADNANTQRVAGYGLLNARAGTRLRLGATELETFLAVHNLLDKDYFSNVRLNQAGGNFLEPGPGRNLIGGVRVRF